MATDTGMSLIMIYFTPFEIYNFVNDHIGVSHGEIGYAVQIIEGEESGTGFKLNTEGLRQVLFHPDVENRPVVIVSVAGAFRKGKSFLLDFMLRYLKQVSY